MDVDCIFCYKLALLETAPPEELVWKFPNSVALLGQWQYYNGYCVLVARRHATELNDLSPGERRAFLDEMCLLAQAITSCVQPRKLNYELLGNQVPHLHWHLFPRYDDDPEKLKPVWVAVDRTGSDLSERTRLQTGPISRTAMLRKLHGKLLELTGDV